MDALLKGSNSIWVDPVFDVDFEYVKKSVGFYDSFEKSCVIFQNSCKKLIFEFFLRKKFSYDNMLLGLGYRMLKTADLYLVPLKSYSKGNRLSWLLAPILVF